MGLPRQAKRVLKPGQTRPWIKRARTLLLREIEEGEDTYVERKETFCTVPNCDCQVPCWDAEIGGDDEFKEFGA